MIDKSTLRVTSHVGRDLLQAAASFKTDYAVVWEYVINALQYVDEGVAPKVQVYVHPRAREIEVADNGRGMSSADLERFFTMHAENIDRLRGRAGRGKFGTGKSAAFGIGVSLEIDTRRGNMRKLRVFARRVDPFAPPPGLRLIEATSIVVARQIVDLLATVLVQRAKLPD